MYRSHTILAETPRRFDEPVVILNEAKNNVFEGSCVYRVKGINQLLLLVECIGKRGPRYHRAFTTDRLDGEWKPCRAPTPRRRSSRATPTRAVRAPNRNRHALLQHG